MIQPDQPDRTLTSPPKSAPPADETECRNEATDRNTVPPPAGIDDSPDATRTSPANSTPARIGRYLIRRLLGKGGMGSVYLAHDPELDRPVALKVPQVSGAEAGERFLREARAAAAVSHPNLCPVYDAGRADDVHYLAMAYVSGPTLTQVLRESGSLPLRRAVAVVAGIARGVAEAHRHGIVHRDLKPSNVLINGKGEPVVTDFGLALRTGVPDLTAAAADTPADARLTQAGAIMGTPAYMSPEQARGEVDKVGPAADVYALGAILHELLTGQPPFRADSMPALIRKIVSEPPPAPSAVRAGIPAGLDAVVRRALAKEPTERFATADEFAAALAPFAAAPPARRWWPVAVAVGFIALAAVAGVVFYVKTDNGTVEVRLNDATADVQVSVDGDQITVTDGERKTTLRPGEHALLVKGPDFETETRVFRVKRGEKAVLEIELKPKEKPVPKGDPPKAAPKSDPKATDRTRLAQLLDRGESLVKVGRMIELDEVAAEALKIDPESPGALALRATYRYDRGEVAAARADAEAALKLNPETYQALIIRAVSDDKSFDLSIADLTVAARLRPDNPMPLSNRALAYHAKREYRQAVADATRAIELGDGRNSPWQTRGAAYAYLGDLDRAAAEYTRAIAIAPTDPRGYIQRSAVYARKGDEEKAAADWETARKLSGKPLRLSDRPVFPLPPKPAERKALTADEQAAFDKAFAAAQKAWDGNRFEDCGTALEGAVEIDPTSAPARSLRARLWAKLGRAADARREVDEAIRLDPNDPWAYMTRGVLADPEKNPAAAVADYTIALRIDPKNHVGWSNRGWAYFNRGQYHQALADLDQAIRVRPDFAPAYSNRGACQLYLGRYEQAEADYGKAIQSDARNPQWLVIRSAVRVKRGDLAGAEADRTAVVALDPRLADAPGFVLPDPLPEPKPDPEVGGGPKADAGGANRTRLAGLLARGRQMIDDANQADLAAVAREALAIDPESPGALAIRATLHLINGRAQSALSDAEAALKLNPETFQAIVIRGTLSGTSGKFDEAIADFTAAIRLRPDHPGAYALRSQGYLEKKEYRQVVADATRAIELGHKLPDPFINRASAYAFLGEYAKAVADYDAAIKLVPNPNYYIQRSAVHAKAGDAPKAEADWAEAKTLVPGLPDKARLVLPDATKPVERKKLTAEEAATVEMTLTKAEAALKQSQWTACRDATDTVLKIDPTSAKAHSLRGRAFNALAQFKEAEAAANDTIRLDPDDAWAYAIRGAAKAQTNPKEVAAAVADDTIALRIDPTNSSFWNNRSYAYTRQGMHHQALADITECLRLRPNFPIAYPNRGSAYLHLGEYQKALADYRTVANSQPKSARWRVLCAAICARLGDKDGEAKERALAVAIDPKAVDGPYLDLPVPLPPVKLDPTEGEPK